MLHLQLNQSATIPSLHVAKPARVDFSVFAITQAANRSIFSFDDPSYSYPLWSSCGVEPVTQKCPPSPIVIYPVPVDPTCTAAVAEARLTSITCRKKYVEDTRRKLSVTQGCTDYKYPGGGVCNANANGVYCKALLSMDQNYTAASESCQDTSRCDLVCIDTLNSITNTVGCCFMDQYNSTSRATEKWLSYDFWLRCDLQSPGYCKEFLNNLQHNLRTIILTIMSTVAFFHIICAHCVL